MIRVAEIEMRSPTAVFQENNYNRWNYRFKQQTLKLPYTDLYDVGRFYVYLMSGDKPICFYKADL